MLRPCSARRCSKPAHGEHQGRTLALQQAGELGDEGVGEVGAGLDHGGEDQHDAGRIDGGDGEHAPDPVGGPLAIAAPGGDPRGDAAQVLDQRQAQHDRHGPQLAERERARGLVGGDEGTQAVDVDAAVRVRDELDGDVVDAGGPRGERVGEARQLAAVAAGQVAPGGPDLLLDQVVVVDEPLRGGRDARAGPDRGGEQGVGVAQRELIGAQARQQVIDESAARRGELVPAGEGAGVVLEAG